MKKFLCFLLSLMLLTAAAGVVFAEEEEGDGAGEVIVLEEGEEAGEDLTADSEPYVPDGADKAVFGSDSRVTVKNLNQHPYAAIAYMEVHAKCGCTWSCNGFMTDKDRLLTAAQCLVCPDHSEWADQITFYFGYKNSRNYSYKYTGGWSAYVGNVFSNGKYSIDYDYGIVKLKKDVGKSTGWFGAHWGLSDLELEKKYLYVAGYQGGKLMYDSGYVIAEDPQHMVFKLDTGAGIAGSPIFGTDNYAVGIAIAYNDRNNIGYRLTYSMYKDYQKK